MARFFAGVASCFLLVTGAFLLWQGRAQEPTVPKAPPPRLAAATPMTLSPIPNAPSADPKSKEEKRFARADKDENGRITPFAKLDLNGDGELSFEEWADRRSTSSKVRTPRRTSSSRRGSCGHCAHGEEGEAGV